VRKIDVDEDGVYWSKRVTLPYRPHIGTLSCSPEIDSINTLTPDSHGGNMDLPDMGPGSITYLPVRTAGARLFIGDAHACQGDGEVCGTAVEYPSTTTIQVDLIKGWNLEWPRLENETRIMCIGSARPLEDATRIAYKELVLWMEAEYGYDRWDAYMMLSQCGQVRLGNFVDPKYTVGAGHRQEVPGALRRLNPFPSLITHKDIPWISDSRACGPWSPAAPRASAARSRDTLAAEGTHVAFCARNADEVAQTEAALRPPGRHRRRPRGRRVATARRWPPSSMRPPP
jgi:hypothetical protein